VITIQSVETIDGGYSVMTAERGHVLLSPGSDDQVEGAVEGWLAAGGEALPRAEPKPTVSNEVHGAYLRAALAEAGKLDTVRAALAKQPVKLALFEGATSFRRGEPDLEAGAEALGIDLDAMFARAEELRRSRG
jgi:hypothetical protein